MGEKKAERILAAAQEWLAAQAAAVPPSEPVGGEAAAPVGEGAGERAAPPA